MSEVDHDKQPKQAQDIVQDSQPPQQESLIKPVSSRNRAPSESSASSSSDDDYSLYDETVPSSPWPLLRRYFVFSLLKQMGFIFTIVYLQHIGSFLLAVMVQIYFYRDLTKYGIRKDKESILGRVLKGGFWMIYWYWFFIAAMFGHWKILDGQLSEDTKKRWNLPVGKKAKADYEFYLFFFYTLGVVGFVLMLRKRHYKYQFKRFAYCHILVFVLLLSCLVMDNIFKGLIFFALPLQLVSINSMVLKIIRITSTGRDDTFQYKHLSFSFRLGSLPNISFFVAWIATIFIGFLISRFLMNYDLFICEKDGVEPVYWPTCERPEMFILRPLKEILGARAAKLPGWVGEIQICAFDEHFFWMAQFASFVSPFGGFFTAAFKRGFKIRPDQGQGPFADRLDCHVLTGVFTYIYLQGRVFFDHSRNNVDSGLEFLDLLTDDKKIELFQSLGKRLVDQGILD